jgi:hypothetical protein
MTHIDDMHDAMLERTAPAAVTACDDDDDMPRFDEEPETEFE